MSVGTATRDRSHGTAPSRPRGLVVTDPNSVRRTLLALLATGLGVIPLKGLFSDYGWLLDVWLTMIVVLGPAAFLRRRRPPGALDIWPGIVLMVPWLTLRFVRSHAIAGLIPGPATWHDVSLLLADLHRTTRDDVAPIHTTVAVRLVVCALLGLVAALVDLVAVVGRRGALAGVPLLVVYTVAGAVPRRPVSWLWFAFAAVGFLILLGLDSEDVLTSWGRRIRPPRGSRGANVVSVTTPRIAVVAVVVAIALPLLVPSQSRNLISDAFHGGSGSGAGSGVAGFGGGSGGSIAPFAKLKGQLDRHNPVTLMKVQMLGKATTQPFYLRVNVLTDYTGDGFEVSDHGPTDQIGASGRPSGAQGGLPFPTEPGGTGTAVQLKARISLTDQVRGNAPAFAIPTSVQGLASDATWSDQDQILLGQNITGSTAYTETFDQPAPTAAQLQATGNSVGGSDLSPYLGVSGPLPKYVVDRVDSLTHKGQSLYQRALAINNYFTNPNNGFLYSLQTKVGDSGSALVDFLKHKQGYCQQFAAAEAVMMRAAGVPSRVVLGYMHAATNSSGSFSVTTSDAHAWVEAYFPGQGWIPFDPTPSSGLAGNSKTDLPWARHRDLPTGTSTGGAQPTISRSGQQSTATSPTTAPSSRAAGIGGSAGGGPTSLTPLWWTLGGLAVIALVLFPAGTRGRRRRSRFAAARHDGDAVALWAELSDTAVDLGYPWSAARTPRQVASWLARDAPRSASWLTRLADAVERQRYSRVGTTGADTAALTVDARAAFEELGSRRSRAERLRAALWPASLQWGRGLPAGWLARRRS